ncbi:basic salivary proline-rich protein 3-like [Homarus americanus]|uniref:basic salivary proline-rich protein 3-like n=1 Tax=Homarus americanus TaxID=6706 RepID=UPI001C445A17|nr:basic salivary proline-rich protein 3-like [Homarus americanus]
MGPPDRVVPLWTIIEGDVLGGPPKAGTSESSIKVLLTYGTYWVRWRPMASWGWRPGASHGRGAAGAREQLGPCLGSLLTGPTKVWQCLWSPPRAVARSGPPGAAESVAYQGGPPGSSGLVEWVVADLGPPIGRACECPGAAGALPGLWDYQVWRLNPPKGGGALSGPPRNGRVPKGPTRGDPPGSSIAWRPARCWCATNGPHRCGGTLRGPPRAVGTPKDFPSSGGIPRCLLRGVSALKGPPRSGGASRKIPWGGVEQIRPPKGICAHRGPLRGICYHSGPFRDDGIPGVLTSEMAPPWALPDTWFPLWTIIGAATSLGGPPKAGGAPRGPP